MDRYSVFCSGEELLNEDINEEVVKGNIPISMSCVLGRDISCCVLIKKHVERGEDWIPEPGIRKRS
ncbi:MAG: hypothetical protein IMZ64_13645 [Bacteroidetes bacterium]|nr:hypothetical protein [Bacteroidota bacterium]